MIVRLEGSLGITVSASCLAIEAHIVQFILILLMGILSSWSLLSVEGLGKEADLPFKWFVAEIVFHFLVTLWSVDLRTADPVYLRHNRGKVELGIGHVQCLILVIKLQVNFSVGAIFPDESLLTKILMRTKIECDTYSSSSFDHILVFNLHVHFFE